MSIDFICWKLRGFEVAKGFGLEGINLPARADKGSAGYDLEAAKDITIQPIWKSIYNLFKLKEEDPKILKPTLVPTGLKAYMQDDEVLYLYNRSSNPMKGFLLLGNGVGVIDSSYYENVDNDGHIMVQFLNFGFFPVTIKKGERIAQGVFSKFLKTDEDFYGAQVRKGGFGSSGVDAIEVEPTPIDIDKLTAVIAAEEISNEVAYV